MKKIISILTISLLLTSCMGMAQKGAFSSAQKNYAKKNYKSAYMDIIRAENYKKENVEIMPAIILLKGDILTSGYNVNEGKATFEYLIDKYPDSQEAYRAKEKLKIIEKIQKVIKKHGSKVEKAKQNMMEDLKKELNK